ncbi:MAG: trigger factor [Acidobacteriota bacterium]
MSVVTSFEETGPCRKKLTIEVPAAAVKAELDRVVGNFRKEVKMPGFRNGKVPVSLIKKRFESAIRQEVVERLVPRYWHQAKAEKNLDVLTQPRFEELDELEPGKPITLVATVETRPEIELGKLDDFDLPSGETEVTDGDVDEALNDLRRHHATWTPVDRAAGQGDLVSGHMVSLGGDETTKDDAGDENAEEESAAEPQPINVELGAEGVDEELTLALTGRSAGQSSEYTGKAGDEEQAYRIDILAVKEQELPELDDEFAKRFGPETVDELRQGVSADLQRRKERELRSQRERALLEQLRQRYPLELPEGVVEQESERMLHEYAERLHAQGVDVETADLNWEAMAESLKPEAERRVHDQLLLDAVSAAEGLRLDESEFERFLAVAASQQKLSSLALRQKLSESGRLEPLRAQMLRERTVRFLLGEDADEEAEAGEETEAAEEAATDSENGT